MAIETTVKSSRRPLRAEVNTGDRVLIQTGRPRTLSDTGLGQLSRTLPRQIQDVFGQVSKLGDIKSEEAEKALLANPNLTNPELLRELGVPSIFSNLITKAADEQRGQNTFQSKAPAYKMATDDFAAQNPGATPDQISAFAQDFVRKDLASAGVTNNHAASTLALVGRVQRAWVNGGIIKQAEVRQADAYDSMAQGMASALFNGYDMTAYVAQQRQTWVTEKKYLSQLEFTAGIDDAIKSSISTLGDDIAEDRLDAFLAVHYAGDMPKLNLAREAVRVRMDRVASREEDRQEAVTRGNNRTMSADRFAQFQLFEPALKDALTDLSTTGDVSPDNQAALLAAPGGARALHTLRNDWDAVTARTPGIGSSAVERLLDELYGHKIENPTSFSHTRGMSTHERMQWYAAIKVHESRTDADPSIQLMRVALIDQLQSHGIVSRNMAETEAESVTRAATGSGGSEASLIPFTGGAGVKEGAVVAVRREQKRLARDWYKYLGEEPPEEDWEAKQNSLIAEAVTRLGALKPAAVPTPDKTPTGTPGKITPAEKAALKVEQRDELAATFSLPPGSLSPAGARTLGVVQGIGGIVDTIIEPFAMWLYLVKSEPGGPPPPTYKPSSALDVGYTESE